MAKHKTPQKSKSAAPAKSKAKPAKAAAAKAKPASAANKASKGAAKAAKPAAKPAAKAKAAAAPAPKKKPAAKLEMKAAPAKKPAAAPKVESKAEKFMAKAAAHNKANAAAAAAKTKLGVAPKAPKVAEKPAEAAKPAPQPEVRKEEKKPVFKPQYKAKEFVVYPSHGVGQIVEVVEQEVAGHKLELYVINFEKEKMTLRVPTNKAQAVGMRKLSDATVVGSAIDTLKGRARIKRTMWSRRAQEYEAKINSGDLISIAEVVRDLYRSERQPEQSYSERQLYEAALDRMAREVAAVEKIGEDAAVQRVEAALQGGSGRGEKIVVEADDAKPEEGEEEAAA